MYTINPWHLPLFIVTLGVSNIAVGQTTTLSTTPQKTVPTISNERLGTGVPSRLPKADIQRPVYTIQSGGPVALPLPQFRPTREVTTSTNPATEVKGSLPIIEQTRPWQKPSQQNKTTSERWSPPLTQPRPATAQATPLTTRPGASSQTSQQPQLTAELLTPVRLPPAITPPAPGQTQPRPAAASSPASQTPARVLNFSIN